MKKFFSIMLVFTIAINLTGCFLFNETEAPPKITKGEFPFYVEILFDGETHIYEDSVVCTFSGYDYSAWFQKPRTWEERFKSCDEGPANKLIFAEENSKSALDNKRTNVLSRLMLNCGTGEYYMGESELAEISEPCFYYFEEYEIGDNTVEWETTPLDEKELEKYFGVKVIRFEFSAPIKNEFRATD